MKLTANLLAAAAVLLLAACAPEAETPKQDKAVDHSAMDHSDDAMGGATADLTEAQTAY